MKKAISFSMILSILCVMLLLFSSCGGKNNSCNEKLKYYTSNCEDDFVSIVRQYNKYCLEKYNESYQIEIIEFDAKEDMNTKLSTEIMAGGGPDIISLSQMLPFEKLIDNNALLDINSLIDNDKTNDKININQYNSAVINAGVYCGKWYIVPLSYGLDVLVSTLEIMNKFGIPLENGAALTYGNISDRFSSFFSSKTNYNFVSNYKDILYYDHPIQLFNRFINNYVNFENKMTYFDSDEFRNNIDDMYKMIEHSSEGTSNTLFDDLYINRSLPLITGKYAYYKSIGETPVVCRGLVKNNDAYSAFIQVGFAINKNTNFKEQVLAFTKYALSEDVQMEICGARGNSYSASIAFPVNKKAYEQSKRTASTLTNDNDEIIGIDNDFMNTYINIAENINICTLYMDVSHSYYNSCVIGNIVDKYLNGEISKEKFIRQLKSATEIYLSE